MKKMIALAAALTTLLAAGAAFAQEASQPAGWDQFVAQMAQQQQIKNGEAIVEQLAAAAPQVSDKELWKLSCSAPDLRTQAAASLALVKKLFPNGDPSQWENVSGFFPPSSYMPLQLVAVNALFNAVTAMTDMTGDQEALYGAAWLMTQFGKSSSGKLIFIDNMPQHFRTTLDKLIAATNLPGLWSSSKIEGPWPFVPTYQGTIPDSLAFGNNYQFLNGWGQIANFGGYAWNRAQGYVYQVISSDDNDIIKFP